MSTLTLELEDEANSLLQTEARKVNLSLVEFARLAIVPELEKMPTLNGVRLSPMDVVGIVLGK